MAKRTTITLSEQHLEVLQAVADASRPEGATLRRIAEELGVQIDGGSEAGLIRGLLTVGAAALQQRALECGYQQLAEIYPEVHDAAEATERRRRYARRVDANMDG